MSLEILLPNADDAHGKQSSLTESQLYVTSYAMNSRHKLTGQHVCLREDLKSVDPHK